MSFHMDKYSKNHRAKSGKYLTFMLDSEFYSVQVLQVQEIIRLSPITSVPRMPVYVKGVLNLRGKIIPIIDLRDRFSMPILKDVVDERRCIVVSQYKNSENSCALMGMIVDSVMDVTQFLDSDIEATPDFGSTLDIKYIIGMAKQQGAVYTLLDLDKLLNIELNFDAQKDDLSMT